MKESNTIRLLDKYAGSMVCFLFTVINTFKPKKKVKEIKNVLFLELFEMGASIMACPSIRYVMKVLDNPGIYVLCMDDVRESWELLQVIPRENIVSLNGKNLLTLAVSIIKQVLYLRRKKLNLIIDLELFTRISSIIVFLIKSELKAGFHRCELEGLYRGNFYDIKCCFNQNMHITRNFLALSKTAILRKKAYPNFKDRIDGSEIFLPRYQSNERLNLAVKEKLSRYYGSYKGEDIIIICPDVGKNLSVRNYPADNYIQIIKRLLSYHEECLILLIGVRENLEVCSYIASQVDSKRCINFCAQTSSLKELMELFLISKMYIGNDNGPAHFASLTQIKTLSLFSAESPFVYGPLGNCLVLYSYFHCSPCVSAFNHKRTRCKNNLCVKSIDPELVFQYARELLEGKAKYRTVNNETFYLRQALHDRLMTSKTTKIKEFL
jgi:ADP-heptose:LPS heptosyltransferase